MIKIDIRSQAKINIGLFVTEKRTDGYHNIETLFYPIDLADTLVFTKAEKLLYLCDNTELQTNPEANLIVKAIRLLEKEVNELLPVRINHTKIIPMGAGLGGGSSNAAITLLSVNELFQTGISMERLKILALQLGSDVPFFLRPVPAVGRGRGELLKEISLSLNLPMLIVNPQIHVSTAMAYQSVQPKPAEFNLELLHEFTGADYELLRKKVTNDFEFSVFSEFPEIKKLKELLYASGAVYSLMSGSGSTVYAFFPDTKELQAAVEKLPSHYFMFSI